MPADVKLHILGRTADRRRPKVEYRQLPDTEFYLPEIGLGTSLYAGGVEPIRRGIELGATLIDTAEDYGTEELVGEAVRPLRNRVMIATKVSAPNFRYQDVLDAADRSLNMLNTDWIDLYQLQKFSPTIPLEETLGAMEYLVEAGKIRFIGVSNFTITQLKRAQAALSKHSIVSKSGKIQPSCPRRGKGEFRLLPGESNHDNRAGSSRSWCGEYKAPRPSKCFGTGG